MSKKKANPFEDLNDLHDKTAALVTELEGTVTTYKEVRDVIQLKNRDEVENAVRTIEADIKTYREDLEKIHSEHKDWKGRPKRPNQFIECHSIGNDYFTMMNAIMSATTPLASEVIAAISEGTK